MAAVGRALDLLLPSEPCTSAARDQISALWLGPDQWLVTCPARDVPGLLASLREALAGVHAAITDVTDGRVAFRLAGPSARDVLAKGCPLDLHPRAFPPGRCAQSLLAKAVGADPPRATTTRSAVPASTSTSPAPSPHYLWTWLEDAGREYGVLIEPPG